MQVRQQLGDAVLEEERLAVVVAFHDDDQPVKVFVLLQIEEDLVKILPVLAWSAGVADARRVYDAQNIAVEVKVVASGSQSDGVAAVVSLVVIWELWFDQPLFSPRSRVGQYGLRWNHFGEVDRRTIRFLKSAEIEVVGQGVQSCWFACA